MNGLDRSNAERETAGATSFIIEPRDSIAIVLLQQVMIPLGYPSPDPEKQIATAYLYADSILKIRGR
jgi:hypothetical protein